MRVQRRKHAATRVACRLESVADPTALLGCRMVTSHLSARGKWERETEIGRRSESGREVRARRAADDASAWSRLRRGPTRATSSRRIVTARIESERCRIRQGFDHHDVTLLCRPIDVIRHHNAYRLTLIRHEVMTDNTLNRTLNPTLDRDPGFQHRRLVSSLCYCASPLKGMVMNKQPREPARGWL